MQEHVPFGVWLRDRRRAQDWTRADLARRIGCAVETVRKLESGERRPSKQLAELLAAHLGVPAADRPAFLDYARAPGRAPGAAPGRAGGDARPAPPPNNLRVPLTPLVGREQAVAAAGHYLRDGAVRLLTLLGPPGVGKTRLAIQVALSLLPSFADGVYFVSLAPVLEPALVLPTVARTLGLEDAARQPALPRLVTVLHARQLLLLLDNFEQVVQGAPELRELLELCPHLALLVTSRAALHVQGEQQFAVPPLAAPDLAGPLTAHAVADSPAVALFVSRAQAVKPDFALTDANAAAVAGLCAQLDGLPLAIELVAARVKMLPPQGLLARMPGRRGQGHEQLHLLTGGPPDQPARHRTLREAIQWSYDLLGAEDRRLFARLSVFSGGGTLVAVEAICNARGDLGASAFALVESLLDKSLLQVGAGSPGASPPTGAAEPRFMMLETIREYAAEQLAQDGEAARLGELHAEYYLALAEAADPQLTGAEQQEWLDRLERDHDNLGAALDWALGHGAVQTAAQLGVALRRFWEVHNHFSEGRRWLGQILAQAERIPAALRARVLNGAGALAGGQGDYDAALALLGQALAEQRALGDDQGAASALNNLGMVALSGGRRDQAIPFFEEGLRIYRALGDTNRGAIMLGNLAVGLSQQGEYGRAAALLEESLSLRRAAGNKWGMAAALGNLAEVARAQGQYTGARARNAAALALLQELGDRVGVAKTLTSLAALDLAGGQAARAATLLSVAETLFAAVGAPLSLVDQAEYAGFIAGAQAELDAPAFKRAWAAGREMSLEQAVALALESD